MENFNMRDIIPLLSQFGVSPEQLGPEKLETLLKISEHIKNPVDITPEIARQIFDIIGVNTREKQLPIKRTNMKIGRNDPCLCGTRLKYKKCCGQSK